MNRLNKTVFTLLFALFGTIFGAGLSHSTIYNILMKILELFRNDITSEQIDIYILELMPYQYIFTIAFAILSWLFSVSIAKLLLELFEKPQS